MSSTAKQLAATDPTMAALIERVGKIDLKTRLKRRSEERPPDAYGALLRAIGRASCRERVLRLV